MIKALPQESTRRKVSPRVAELATPKRDGGRRSGRPSAGALRDEARSRGTEPRLRSRFVRSSALPGLWSAGPPDDRGHLVAVESPHHGAANVPTAARSSRNADTLSTSGARGRRRG